MVGRVPYGLILVAVHDLISIRLKAKHCAAASVGPGVPGELPIDGDNEVTIALEAQPGATVGRDQPVVDPNVVVGAHLDADHLHRCSGFLAADHGQSNTI